MSFKIITGEYWKSYGSCIGIISYKEYSQRKKAPPVLGFKRKKRVFKVKFIPDRHVPDNVVYILYRGIYVGCYDLPKLT